MQDAHRETQLLQQSGEGDRAAFDELVQRTSPAVWTVCRRLTSGEDAAEDAMQETYVAAWRGAAAYRDEGSVRAWLYGLARRQAARTWRRRAGEPTAPIPLHELGALAGWGADPEVAAARAEDRAHLLHALSTLSELDQEIVMLCDLQGLSGPEAGSELGLSANTARVRLHRARLHLMAALRKEGFDA